MQTCGNACVPTNYHNYIYSLWCIDLDLHTHICIHAGDGAYMNEQQQQQPITFKHRFPFFKQAKRGIRIIYKRWISYAEYTSISIIFIVISTKVYQKSRSSNSSWLTRSSSRIFALGFINESSTTRGTTRPIFNSIQQYDSYRNIKHILKSC